MTKSLFHRAGPVKFASEMTKSLFNRAGPVKFASEMTKSLFNRAGPVKFASEMTKLLFNRAGVAFHVVNLELINALERHIFRSYQLNIIRSR